MKYIAILFLVFTFFKPLLAQVEKDTTQASLLFKEGEQFIKTGKFDDAYHKFSEASKYYLSYLNEFSDKDIWVKYFSSQVKLGFILYNQSKLTEADSVAQVSYDLAVQKLSEKHNVLIEILNLRSILADNLSQYDRATSLFEQTAKLIKELQEENSPLNAVHLYNYANLKGSLGDYIGAQKDHERSLTIRKELYGERHKDVAISYSGLGTLYWEQQQLNKAKANFEKAIEITKEVAPEDPNLSVFYGNLGAIYSDLGLYNESIHYSEIARKMREEIYGPRSADMIYSYNALGIAEYGLGNFSKSAEYLLLALEITEEVYGKEAAILGDICNNIGIIYLEGWDYENALTYLFRAVNLRRKLLGDAHPALSKNFQNISSVYVMQGDFNQALLFSKRAQDISLAKHGEVHLDVANAYLNQAIILNEKEQYQESFAYLRKCLQIRQQVLGMNHPDVGRVLKLLGAASANLKEFEQAISYQKRAIDLYNETLGPEHPSVARALMDLAVVRDSLKEYEKALDLFLEAKEVYHKAYEEKHAEVCDINMSIAHHFRTLGNYKQALDYAQEALKSIIPTFNPQSIFDLPDRFTEVLERKKCFSALVLYGRLLYEISNDRNYLEAANKTFNLALNMLEELQQSVSSETFRLELRKQAPLLIELAIQAADQLFLQTQDNQYIAEAFYFAEKGKASILNQAVQRSSAKQFAGLPQSIIAMERSLKSKQAYFERMLEELTTIPDSLGREQVLSYRQQLLATTKSYDSLQVVIEHQYPKYWDLKYNNTVANLQDIQAYLAKHQSFLIEYFYGETQMFVFAIGPDQVHLNTFPIPKLFNKQVLDFRKLLINSVAQDDKELQKQFANQGFEFFQQLIQPSFDFIDQPNLVIIPDGPLGYLPFDILLTRQPELYSYRTFPYLLNAFPIQYEYSGSLLIKAASKNKSSNGRYIGFAPTYESSTTTPGFTTTKARDFTPLKYNTIEVRKIASLWNGKSFIGEQATEANFRAQINQNEILHLAMHAYINDKTPIYSGLIFYQADAAYDKNQDSTEINFEPNIQFDAEDGVLHVYELYNLETSAELGVLSACNTGFGDVAQGEGVISLARAFKYAGCPSILTSLWQANDYVTERIMTTFFTKLKEGKTKAQAIQQAKLSYLQEASEAEAHPFYWASFVLIGENKPMGTHTFNWYWLLLILMLVFGGFVYAYLKK